MKVTVIGTGNVGSQFASIFNTSPVSSRTLEGLPLDSDLYIIAVSDSAVAEVASNLPPLSGIVVHTTGSVPMEVLSTLKCKGYGVFYPFQTLSKKRPLLPSQIPLLIEASDKETEHKLLTIASTYGFDHPTLANSDMRRKVHLAGAFACNFANAVIGIGQEILEDCGIDPGILNPLVAETMEKLKTLPAREAQTGPAVRRDFPTMEKHLALLTDLGMDLESSIYRSVSDRIITKALTPNPN